MVAIFLVVFLFGLADYPANCNASVVNTKVYSALQKKAKVVKLKVSVKNKTKNSSIKLTGTTGAYFTVIISVNGQEKTTLTANKKGAFKFNVPLDLAVNTVNVRAFNGTITQTVSKVVKRTGKIIASPAPSIVNPVNGGATKSDADLAAEKAKQDEDKRLADAAMAKVEEDRRLAEAAQAAAKLAEDKANYNLAIVQLENDYDRNLAKLQTDYDAAMEDFNNRGAYFSGAAEAVRNQFKTDCDALKAKYDADLKAIEATKYW